MSNPGDADATPITSLKQLADHIAAGCKPPAQFRMEVQPLSRVAIECQPAHTSFSSS